MKCCHLIYIPFTGVGLHDGFRGDIWYNKRISIFEKFTLKSLSCQNNKSFLLWMSFRPQEANNLLTQKLAEYVKNLGISYIFTFNGLMYNDDKFPLSWKERIKQARKYKSRECFKNKNADLQERIGKSLEIISKVEDIKNTDWVYVTRLDSDDVIDKDFIKDTQDIEPFKGVITSGQGYIYNSITNEMARWNNITNPPFFTWIFKGSEFNNSFEHWNYIKDYITHEEIPYLFEHKKLTGRRFCVVIHDSHISTNWDHSFRGEKVNPDLIKNFVC